MIIKRIKKIRIGGHDFEVRWPKDEYGAYFNYGDRVISIGTKDSGEDEIFESVCHELLEMCAVTLRVRLDRPDCNSDYIFVYDHRQHTTIVAMFSGLLREFIK